MFLAVDTDEDRSLVKPFLDNKWSQNGLFRGWPAEPTAGLFHSDHPILNKKGEVFTRMVGFLPDRFVDMLTERVNDALGNPRTPPSPNRPSNRRRSQHSNPSSNSSNDRPSFPRVTWIVLDSVGAGEMPDAAAYGDAGSDTLGHIASARELHLPNLARLGLGNLKALAHVGPVDRPTAAFGKCALASPGKDTTTGHWEMAGIHLAKPFPLFPHGFPPEVMQEFEQRIGRGTLGNNAASGTEIISELGEEHMRTG